MYHLKRLRHGVKSILPDKNKYVREYHGPVEIEKMQVRLYDEKGFEMDFNGANWSLTMVTEHLYKY